MSAVFSEYQSSTINYRRHVKEHKEKIKINLIIENK